MVRVERQNAAQITNGGFEIVAYEMEIGALVETLRIVGRQGDHTIQQLLRQLRLVLAECDGRTFHQQIDRIAARVHPQPFDLVGELLARCFILGGRQLGIEIAQQLRLFVGRLRSIAQGRFQLCRCFGLGCRSLRWVELLIGLGAGAHVGLGRVRLAPVLLRSRARFAGGFILGLNPGGERHNARNRQSAFQGTGGRPIRKRRRRSYFEHGVEDTAPRSWRQSGIATQFRLRRRHLDPNCLSLGEP